MVLSLSSPNDSAVNDSAVSGLHTTRQPLTRGFTRCGTEQARRFPFPFRAFRVFRSCSEFPPLRRSLRPSAARSPSRIGSHPLRATSAALCAATSIAVEAGPEQGALRAASTGQLACHGGAPKGRRREGQTGSASCSGADRVASDRDRRKASRGELAYRPRAPARTQRMPRYHATRSARTPNLRASRDPTAPTRGFNHAAAQGTSRRSLAEAKAGRAALPHASHRRESKCGCFRASFAVI